MKNKYGKLSKLYLETANYHDRVILKDLSFTAPFKIMSPFKLENGTIQVMLLSASAGIMEGDEQEITIHVADQTSLEFISQSYEKIHKMKDGEAKRRTEIYVGESAYLYYNPLPIIPFAQSAFQNELTVHLFENTSRFVLKEILSCGRYASGEQFQYRYYRNYTRIYLKDKLIYIDNTDFCPEKMPMMSIGFFEKYTHLANVVLCNIDLPESEFFQVRSRIEEEESICGGITLTQSQDVVIRIFGRQAEVLENVIADIMEIIKISNRT